jgi:hypothetical protein
MSQGGEIHPILRMSRDLHSAKAPGLDSLETAVERRRLDGDHITRAGENLQAEVQRLEGTRRDDDLVR